MGRCGRHKALSRTFMTTIWAPAPSCRTRDKSPGLVATRVRLLDRSFDMKNMATGEVVYHAYHGVHDLRTYTLDEFLTEVWYNAFALADRRYGFYAAQEAATREKDRAELFYRYGFKSKS